MKPVLLVEDDLQCREVIKDIFEFEHIQGELICVDRAEHAIAMLGDVEPSLILMDLGLPGMSGLEAIKTIKANPSTRRIPIWAVTGQRTGADVDAAFASGCSGYFVKPINLKRVTNDLLAFQSEAEAEAAQQKEGALS